MELDSTDNPGRFFFALSRDLKSIALSNVQYFQNGKQSHHAKFHVTFRLLYEYLDIGIEPTYRELAKYVSEYDFSPEVKGNGYRSLLRVVQKCCLHLLQLCRYISSVRDSMLFRKKVYAKELESYVSALGQLRAVLYYALKLTQYCRRGHLFADEEELNSDIAESLMLEVESLSQESFYGRCLGFQFCESMQRPVQAIGIVMASLSEGYLESSQVMRVATSVFNSGKYFLDPELRAKQMVKVTRTAGIRFCQTFWNFPESPVMHQLPSFVCPVMEVNELLSLGPDAFELPLVEGGDTVVITPPCAHTGPGHVYTRLISAHLREGQQALRKSVKTKTPTPAKSRVPGLIVHFHGGGFVAQSSKSHEVYLRDWAVSIGVPILSVDYSLAPQAPFPRALEECFYAYAWAVKNSEQLGSTGEKILVVGDSAGGNLAISTALRAASFGIRAPDGVVVMYPCTVVKYTPSPARLLSLMDPLLPVGLMARCLAAYAGINEEEPQASPTMGELHSNESLTRIQMGSYEAADSDWIIIAQNEEEMNKIHSTAVDQDPPSAVTPKSVIDSLEDSMEGLDKDLCFSGEASGPDGETRKELLGKQGRSETVESEEETEIFSQLVAEGSCIFPSEDGESGPEKGQKHHLQAPDSPATVTLSSSSRGADEMPGEEMRDVVDSRHSSITAAESAERRPSDSDPGSKQAAAAAASSGLALLQSRAKQMMEGAQSMLTSLSSYMPSSQSIVSARSVVSSLATNLDQGSAASATSGSLSLHTSRSSPVLPSPTFSVSPLPSPQRLDDIPDIAAAKVFEERRAAGGGGYAEEFIADADAVSDPVDPNHNSTKPSPLPSEETLSVSGAALTKVGRSLAAESHSVVPSANFYHHADNNRTPDDESDNNTASADMVDTTTQPSPLTSSSSSGVFDTAFSTPLTPGATGMILREESSAFGSPAFLSDTSPLLQDQQRPKIECTIASNAEAKCQEDFISHDSQMRQLDSVGQSAVRVLDVSAGTGCKLQDTTRDYTSAANTSPASCPSSQHDSSLNLGGNSTFHLDNVNASSEKHSPPSHSYTPDGVSKDDATSSFTSPKPPNLPFLSTTPEEDQAALAFLTPSAVNMTSDLIAGFDSAAAEKAVGSVSDTSQCEALSSPGVLELGLGQVSDRGEYSSGRLPSAYASGDPSSTSTTSCLQSLDMLSPVASPSAPMISGQQCQSSSPSPLLSIICDVEAQGSSPASPASLPRESKELLEDALRSVDLAEGGEEKLSPPVPGAAADHQNSDSPGCEAMPARVPECLQRVTEVENIRSDIVSQGPSSPVTTLGDDPHANINTTGLPGDDCHQISTHLPPQNSTSELTPIQPTGNPLPSIEPSNPNVCKSSVLDQGGEHTGPWDSHTRSGEMFLSCISDGASAPTSSSPSEQRQEQTTPASAGPVDTPRDSSSYHRESVKGPGDSSSPDAGPVDIPQDSPSYHHESVKGPGDSSSSEAESNSIIGETAVCSNSNSPPPHHKRVPPPTSLNIASNASSVFTSVKQSTLSSPTHADRKACDRGPPSSPAKPCPVPHSHSPVTHPILSPSETSPETGQQKPAVTGAGSDIQLASTPLMTFTPSESGGQRRLWPVGVGVRGIQKSDSTPALSTTIMDPSPVTPRPSTSGNRHPSVPTQASSLIKELKTGMSPSDFELQNFSGHSPLHLLRRAAVVKNPYMSPLTASDEMLRGLTRVSVVGCHLDPLLDDSVMFAKRLRDLGVPTDLHIVDDLPHGFLNFALFSVDARQAADLCGRKIRDMLSDPV